MIGRKFSDAGGAGEEKMGMEAHEELFTNLKEHTFEQQEERVEKAKQELERVEKAEQEKRAGNPADAPPPYPGI